MCDDAIWCYRWSPVNQNGGRTCVPYAYINGSTGNWRWDRNLHWPNDWRNYYNSVASLLCNNCSGSNFILNSFCALLLMFTFNCSVYWLPIDAIVVRTWLDCCSFKHVILHPSRKQRNNRNAITQLWSHPFLHSTLLNGCDRDLVMAFLLVSLHFEGWSMTGHP